MTTQNYEYVRGIKELLNKYIEAGELTQIDALSQLSQVLITDDYIIKNINERYPNVIGTEIVDSVRSDLSGIIPSTLRTPWQDFVKFYLKVNCQLALKARLESTVLACSPEQKMVISAFLNLCELGGEELRGAVDLTYFLYSCETAFNIPRKTADNWLVGIGFANRWFYDAKYISHSAWDIPEWVFLASHDIAQNPKQFGIARYSNYEMEEVLKQQKAVDFVSWISGKMYSNWKGIIEESEWREGEQNFENQFGPGSFYKQFGSLVRSGVLSIMSDTGRKFRGYMVYINPDAFALMS